MSEEVESETHARETSYEFQIPSRMWKEGTHHRRRVSAAGMAANIFQPTITFRNEVTKETSSQPYEYDFKLSPQLNLIPGFNWNQWDLVSVAGPIAAPILGLIAGAVDYSIAEHKVNVLYNNILKDGAARIQFEVEALKYQINWENEIKEKQKKESKPTRIEEYLKDLSEKPMIINSYVIGNGNNVNFPSNYSGIGGTLGASGKNDAFVDDIEWGEGAYAEQTTTVKGKVKSAKIVRQHEHLNDCLND
jgi:hypothetical protein